MKFKKKSKKKGRNAPRRNNGAGSVAITRPSRPRLRVPRRGEAPPWKTIGAAVAGSVGGAIASGLIVNQKIAEPETISLLMGATGGLGAYLTDGNARVAFTGLAAAGAGQYTLLKLGDLAVKKAEKEDEAKKKADAEAKATADALAAQQAQAQVAASGGQTAPPRQHARGGRGIVVDLFRDSAADLELLDEDEIHYSPRDADLDDEDDDTPIEIDLDEAA